MGKKSRNKKTRKESLQAVSDLSATKPIDLHIFWANIAVCLLLVVCTLAVYWQVINHDFLNFDDGQYVTENAEVQSGLTLHGLQWAFTTTYTTNWHPLTWLSHMLDCELYGTNPAGHHVTGLLFHLLNTILLFLLLKRMTGAHWCSACVAMLFAIHPLHVESVAWVSERKDVLSTFFWMLTVWFYVDYVRDKRKSRYLLALLMFALGLMSKPMLVTLPFVLLLLDYWPLNRIAFEDARQQLSELKITVKQLLVEKLPFFLLTLVSALITVSVGDVQTVQDFTIWGRIGNALVSYVAYLSDMFWPHPLIIFRPHPGELPFWQLLLALLLLIMITLFVLRQGKQHRFLPVGWFLYLGVLVPVIGLVQVGIQARADRYTYVPLIGIAIIVVWGIAYLSRNWKSRQKPLMATGAVVTLVLMACTYNQVGHMKNSMTAFGHAIKYAPNAHYAHNNLALAYKNAGEFDRAIEYFSEAIRIKPDKYEAYNNRGVAYFGKKEFDKAIIDYQVVLDKMPDHVEARNNLGNIFQLQGKLDQAIEQYKRALQAIPNHPEVNNNIGSAYFSKRDFPKAIEYFSAAINANPFYLSARTNLARVYGEMGEIEMAIKHFKLALELEPNNPMTHDWLGISYAFVGQKEKAIHHYNIALSINPNMQATRQRLQQLAQ
ncbi:tetratricopeptide repeat protein [Pseudomonadota bacterium]